ncbi:hypothetical protein B0H13DRAFT_1868102 [Mycena leptocephala]|nr:hypothetical protein B0H13DRAFT_1868102 [Mycena leptocephala]
MTHHSDLLTVAPTITVLPQNVSVLLNTYRIFLRHRHRLRCVPPVVILVFATFILLTGFTASVYPDLRLRVLLASAHGDPRGPPRHVALEAALPFPEGRSGRCVQFSNPNPNQGWNEYFGDVPFESDDPAPCAISQDWFNVVCPKDKRCYININAPGAKPAPVAQQASESASGIDLTHWRTALRDAPQRRLEIVASSDTKGDAFAFPQIFDPQSPISACLTPRQSEIVGSAVAGNSYLFIPRGPAWHTRHRGMRSSACSPCTSGRETTRRTAVAQEASATAYGSISGKRLCAAYGPLMCGLWYFAL